MSARWWFCGEGRGQESKEGVNVVQSVAVIGPDNKRDASDTATVSVARAAVDDSASPSVRPCERAEC